MREIRVSEIRVSKIRANKIRVREIRVSKIRISSNHRELHGAIFYVSGYQNECSTFSLSNLDADCMQMSDCVHLCNSKRNRDFQSLILRSKHETRVFGLGDCAAFTSPMNESVKPQGHDRGRLSVPAACGCDHQTPDWTGSIAKRWSPRMYLSILKHKPVTVGLRLSVQRLGYWWVDWTKCFSASAQSWKRMACQMAGSQMLFLNQTLELEATVSQCPAWRENKDWKGKHAGENGARQQKDLKLTELWWKMQPHCIKLKWSFVAKFQTPQRLVASNGCGNCAWKPQLNRRDERGRATYSAAAADLSFLMIQSSTL